MYWMGWGKQNNYFRSDIVKHKDAQRLTAQQIDVVYSFLALSCGREVHATTAGEVRHKTHRYNGHCIRK